MKSEEKLLVLGLNHKTAPVEVREKFSLSVERIEKGLADMVEEDTLQEMVILSTCNRSEIYAVAEPDKGLEALGELLSTLTGTVVTRDFIQAYGYVYRGDECITHLLRVTSGLDSLVLGEGQILSQVKHAYALALENGTTDTILNLLFNRALATGKRVRTQTKIACNAVSVSYAAVELAKNIFGQLGNKKVLLFGAGKMAELTASYLLEQGRPSLYVANHHLKRAISLADKYGGTALSWDGVYDKLGEMDIIITSTGAPHYVLRRGDLSKVVKGRREPLVLIDIAVPRDVEPAAGEIEGVELFNIDDLEAVVDDNLQERQQEAVLGEEIVREEAIALKEKYQYLSMQPIMSRLTDKAEEIRKREFKRALRKLPELEIGQYRILEQMTKMLVRKLLREPMISVHQAVGTKQEKELKEAMESLFQLENMGNEVDADE